MALARGQLEEKPWIGRKRVEAEKKEDREA